MKQLEEKILPARNSLQAYHNMLLKWQRSVNLVAADSVGEAWNRHILDSAQVYFLLPDEGKTILDMGSGGGFPGLVLAILGQVFQDDRSVILVESDLKKCLFLQEIIRNLQLKNTAVLNERVEKIQRSDVDVVTSRALASLPKLLELGCGFIQPETTCLFLKGERVDEEIKQNTIPCQIEKIPSLTHMGSSILKVTQVAYNKKGLG